MTEIQYNELMKSIKDLREDFKTHNDILLPAIQNVIDEKLGVLPCKHHLKKLNAMEKRITDLEKEVQYLKESK